MILKSIIERRIFFAILKINDHCPINLAQFVFSFNHWNPIIIEFQLRQIKISGESFSNELLKCGHRNSREHLSSI